MAKIGPLSSTEKARENRIRQLAVRRDLRLVKSRARDPGDFTYGTYALVDLSTGAVVHAASNSPRGFGLSLDEVEDFLAGHTR